MPDQPPAYRALINATGGLVRSIVELHGPQPDHILSNGTETWWQCRGCEADGYEAEYPRWPCATTRLIADHARVPLDDKHYTVDTAPPCPHCSRPKVQRPDGWMCPEIAAHLDVLRAVSPRVHAAMDAAVLGTDPNGGKPTPPTSAA